jgi:hypothetical protein
VEKDASDLQATCSSLLAWPDWLATYPFFHRPKGSSHTKRWNILERVYCVSGLDGASIQDLAMPTLREAMAKGLVLGPGAIELIPQSPVSSLRFGIAGMIFITYRKDY